MEESQTHRLVHPFLVPLPDELAERVFKLHSPFAD
jgi:hypothetical protein